MNKIHLILNLCFFFLLIGSNGWTQCNYISHTISHNEVCGDGTTYIELTLSFSETMIGASVTIKDINTGFLIIGTPGIPNPNDVQFLFSLQHSMINGCVSEFAHFEIEDNSLCGDGITLVNSNGFNQSIEIFPLQPTWRFSDIAVCSGDIINIDILDGNNNYCKTIQIDGTENPSCSISNDVDVIIDFESSLNINGPIINYCWNNISGTFDSDPFGNFMEIYPGPPADYIITKPIKPKVCSYEKNIITIAILAANGVDTCDYFLGDAIYNDGCEPLEAHPFIFLYRNTDWEAATGSPNSCGFGSFTESFIYDVYPEPFSLSIEGDGECNDLTVHLIPADGTVCYTQKKQCYADSEKFNYDFTDPIIAAEYGDLIPWDTEFWFDNCGIDTSIFKGEMTCLNCPEICGFDGAYPYWTSSCLDAHVLCNIEQLGLINTCTPPIAVEDNICEPEGNLCNGPSTADNMSWFAFIAGSNIIDISFLQTDCEGGNNFEAGIWSDCPCNGGICLIGQSSPCVSNVDLLLTNAVIGKTYYMFLDGCMGSQCQIDINFKSVSPFQWECPTFPSLNICSDASFLTDSNICFGDQDTLDLRFEITEYLPYADLLNATFRWSMTSNTGYLPPPFNQDSLITLSEPFVNLKMPRTQLGSYTICFENAENDCHSTNDCNIPACFDFNTILERTDQNWGSVDICYSELITNGFLPQNPPDSSWVWLGPTIFFDDLDSSYVFEHINNSGCNCPFEQRIQFNVIDELEPIRNTIFLCEGDPCFTYSASFGTDTICAQEAIDSLIFLNELTLNGCNLPAVISVFALDQIAYTDTVSSSCNNLEIALKLPEYIPDDILLMIQIDYEWKNETGQIISNASDYNFTTEGLYTLTATFNTTNELGESKQCPKTYNFDINFDNLPLSQPKLWPFETDHCPGNPQNIIFRIQNEGYFNQWQTDPLNLISASGTNNVVGNLFWDGSQDVEVCVRAFTSCDDGVQFSAYVCFTVTADQCACYEDQLSLSGNLNQSNYQAIKNINIQDGVIDQTAITIKAGECIEVESVDINAGAEVLLEIETCPE